MNETPPNQTTKMSNEIDRLDLNRLDVFQRLLKDRIVFLGTAVDDEVANFIIAQMLFLEAQDQEKPISL